MITVVICLQLFRENQAARAPHWGTCGATWCMVRFRQWHFPNSSYNQTAWWKLEDQSSSDSEEYRSIPTKITINIIQQWHEYLGEKEVLPILDPYNGIQKNMKRQDKVWYLSEMPRRTYSWHFHQWTALHEGLVLFVLWKKNKPKMQ